MGGHFLRRIEPPGEPVPRVGPSGVEPSFLIAVPTSPPRVLTPLTAELLTRPTTKLFAPPSANFLPPATSHYVSGDLATGRNVRQEWELFMADVLDRLGVIEQAPSAQFIYARPVPAATWFITHNLATKPTVVIVADDGSQLVAEVDYPDDNTTVITFGQPYTGTAYLHG